MTIISSFTFFMYLDTCKSCYTSSKSTCVMIFQPQLNDKISTTVIMIFKITHIKYCDVYKLYIYVYLTCIASKGGVRKLLSAKCRTDEDKSFDKSCNAES